VVRGGQGAGVCALAGQVRHAVPRPVKGERAVVCCLFVIWCVCSGVLQCVCRGERGGACKAFVSFSTARSPNKQKRVPNQI
jgi:hypothetical protein